MNHKHSTYFYNSNDDDDDDDNNHNNNNNNNSFSKCVYSILPINPSFEKYLMDKTSFR
jgi:hypothetical protein